MYRQISVIKQCLFRRKNEVKPQSLWTNKTKCSLNWNNNEKKYRSKLLSQSHKAVATILHENSETTSKPNWLE
jgi:hypothetical protein